MPYADFMEREDVYRIVSDTLEGYFNAEVSIYEHYQSYNGQIFHCYPRLNAIVPKNYKDELLDFIKRDNRITYSLPRKIIMSSYIYLAFKLPRIFTDKYIVINKPADSFKDILIYPGNKKIKVVNFNTNTVDNILKIGFDCTWFNKEIEIRENPRWGFIPSLKKVKPNVYRERFFKGYAFTRVKNNDKNRFLNELNENIEVMQRDGRIIEIGSYTVELNDKFQERINNIRGRLNNNEYDNLNRLFQNISNLLLNCFSEIKIVFSHGDLQEGNVFIEDNTSKLWILDWETWGERIEHYDKMILFYGLRNSNLLIENMKLFLTDRGIKIGLKNIESESLVNILRLFVLEDILWQIDETTVLINESVSNGLKKYLSLNHQNKLYGILKLD